MLSSVLNSERAIVVNVEIMRTFVRFRQYMAGHAELSAKLKELEMRFEGKLGTQDRQLRMLVEAMKKLREEIRKPQPPAPPKRRIGFHTEDDGPKETKSKARRKQARGPK